MTYLSFNADGFPVLLSGGEIPGGAILLTGEDVAEIRNALQIGAPVSQNGNGWAIGNPPPAPIPQQMTFAQLLIGLVAEGWITEAEGDAWLEGRIPAAARGLIGTLPQAQRFAAKARAARPSIVLRNDPLVTALATAQGRADDLDRFFTTYAAV